MTTTRRAAPVTTSRNSIPSRPRRGSAQNITWRVALPADGSFPVSSLGPTFWFGDTGGKAEVLGHSFVGPIHCTKYGGPYCIYPWYSWGRFPGVPGHPMMK
jgi:hypothetical protein